MKVATWLRGTFEGNKKLAAERQLYRKIDEELVFASSDPLTLGVEFELALLDSQTLQPAHLAPAVIAEANSPQIKKESCEHMVEVTTAVARTAHEAGTQLKQELAKLADICAGKNLLITGTGCPPTVKVADMRPIVDKRQKRLREERKILSDRFATLGMHVHIGMTDAEQCIRYQSFLMHFLPHLVALSASAPFENGMETGLATIRPTITEALPVAAMPYHFRNWGEYVSLCRAMYRSGAIQNLKDIWWDVRPSPRYGTLEVRICDMPATLSEATAIVAFIHALALWFRKNQSWLDEMPRPNAWRARENKWRAMRYGLGAELVINNQGETRPVCEDIRQWIERLQPFITGYDYGDYMSMLEKMMAQGNSSQRQQRLWAATHDLPLIARFNCNEFSAQAPLWEYVEGVGKGGAQKPEKVA